MLEKIAGKRNSQVVASAINNFSTAEKAMDEMAASAGNAMAEMEIAYESIDYKINEFKESAVGLGQTIFTQDFLKNTVSAGTTVIEILDKLIEKFGTIPTLLTSIAGISALKNVGER